MSIRQCKKIRNFASENINLKIIQIPLQFAKKYAIINCGKYFLNKTAHIRALTRIDSYASNITI